MAKYISLTSGSILNGNPITFAVMPNNLHGTSFHRVIVEVECGISGGNYEVIKMSSPVTIEGDEILIDISSALRTFRDTYEYTPYPTVYPLVKFNVKAYDEYMIDGQLHTQYEPVFFPVNPKELPPDSRDDAYLRTIFGSFSDLDRLLSEETKSTQDLSRKPTSTPHLTVVGERFAFTPSFDHEMILEKSLDLVSPESVEEPIVKEGLQDIARNSLFALPKEAAAERQSFRFINSFGVLESINVPRAYSKKLAIKSEKYAIARQETFNHFSRAAIRKQNNQETWLFTTDPLTEEWLYWYLHEFLMSEHVWLLLPSLTTGGAGGGSVWLPCTITPDENTTILDSTKADTYTVSFTALLDINGSPLR